MYSAVYNAWHWLPSFRIGVQVMSAKHENENGKCKLESSRLI